MENSTRNCVCPMCEDGTLQERSDRQFSFRYLRRVHTVDGLEHAVCDRCGTSSFLPGQMERNKARIEKVQRSLVGYIGPQDILALRERYGLTQKLAARIFGGGVRAFSKWERGEVKPAEPTAKLMRLALNDPRAMGSLVKMAGLDPKSDEFAGLAQAEKEHVLELAAKLAQGLHDRMRAWHTERLLGREEKVMFDTRGGDPAPAVTFQPAPGHGRCVIVQETHRKVQIVDEVWNADEPAAA